MTRRRTNSNPVSLFPFLAVLLSAMGSLILLLVVVSRQAQRSRDWEHRSAANQELAQLGPLPERITFPPVEPVPPLDLPPLVSPDLPPLPELKDPRPALESAKRQIEAELRDVTSSPVDSAKEIQKQDRLAELRERLQQLEQEIRRIEEAKALAEKAKQSAESTLKELDARWSKAKATADKAENRFSIVPYFGNNASDREPIYIECRRDRIIVQPEGVEITPLELGNPLDPDNTLAAVVRALLTHSRGKGEQPYPLLVVRPEGIATYYFARLALGGVRTEYGYELVAKDVLLDYGQPDQQSKQITQAIVLDAKSKARRRPGSIPNNDWNFDVAGGGPDDRPTTIQDLRTIRSPTREQLESIARRLPAVGGPQEGTNDASGTAGNSYGSSPISDGDEAGMGQLAEVPVRDIDGDSSSNDGGGEIEAPTLANGPRGTKGDLPNGPENGTKGKTSKDGFAAGTMGQGSSSLSPSAADRLKGLGVSRKLGGTTRSNRDVASIEGATRDASNQNWKRNVTSSTADRPAPNSQSSSSGTRSDASTDDRSLADSADNRGSREEPSANVGSGRPRRSNSAPPNSPNTSTLSGRQNSSASSRSGQGEGAPSTGSPDEFQQALMQAAGGGSSASIASSGNIPVPSIDLSDRPKQTTNSEDEPTGDPNSAGTPTLGPTGSIRETIHKSVVIECRSNGIALYPGGEFIKFDSPTDVSAARRAIYKHVAEQMITWGPPSDIHRWAPVVEFNVRPDGLDRYYDLRLSMTSSGLDIRHRLLSWKDDVDFSEVFGGRRPADEARRRSTEQMVR